MFHSVEFALTNRDTPATTENSGDTTTMLAQSPPVCQTLPSFSLRSSAPLHQAALPPRYVLTPAVFNKSSDDLGICKFISEEK